MKNNNNNEEAFPIDLVGKSRKELDEIFDEFMESNLPVVKKTPRKYSSEALKRIMKKVDLEIRVSTALRMGLEEFLIDNELIKSYEDFYSDMNNHLLVNKFIKEETNHLIKIFKEWDRDGRPEK